MVIGVEVSWAEPMRLFGQEFCGAHQVDPRKKLGKLENLENASKSKQKNEKDEIFSPLNPSMASIRPRGFDFRSFFNKCHFFVVLGYLGIKSQSDCIVPNLERISN